jgi:large subunit ribosomal protein L4
MAQIPYYDASGSKAGTVEVDETLFGKRVHATLLHQVVVAYEANKRQGTHKTKRRGEVQGSGRKPWPQKKLGRARHGMVRSPIWRKGAVTWGPQPRDYSQKINKSMRTTALNSALLGKIRDGEMHVIQSMDFGAPKTAQMRKLLAVIGLGRSVLIGVETHDENRWRSARNLPKVAMSEVRALNAYDILKHKNLLLTRAAFDALVAARRGGAARTES